VPLRFCENVQTPGRGCNPREWIQQGASTLTGSPARLIHPCVTPSGSVPPGCFPPRVALPVAAVTQAPCDPRLFLFVPTGEEVNLKKNGVDREEGLLCVETFADRARKSVILVPQ
jgi:hypothetical protein